jgi:hypothetical protein
MLKRGPLEDEGIEFSAEEPAVDSPEPLAA